MNRTCVNITKRSTNQRIGAYLNTVVLSYAEKFWSPGNIPTDGIGLVSNRFYDAIVASYPEHQVIFSDYSDYSQLKNLKEVDHFFGISTNFEKFCKVLVPKKATLISVNEHPLIRRTIREISSRSGFNRKYLDGHDGIFSNLNENRYADNVIALGSWNTLVSYELAGFDPKQIIPIGWNYWQEFIPEFNESFGNDILVFPGAMCSRKGIGILPSLVKYIHENHKEFRVKLVGFTSNRYWEILLEQLLSDFPDNFLWVRQRIDYGSADWLQMGKGVAFALFPSFEEGLAGCAMDVINLGIPLIHSPKTGIEISHSFILKFDFEHSKWHKPLSELISRGKPLWKEIYQAQRDAAFFQDPDNDSIREAIERSKSESMWPGIQNFEFLGVDEVAEICDSFSLINPKYSIVSAEDQTAQINLCYSGASDLRIAEKIRMSLFILEKYRKFQSLSFSSQDGKAQFILKRLQPVKQSSKQIAIFIPEYTNLYLERGGNLTRLYVIERLRDLFHFLSYWGKRGANIFIQKISFEINKLRVKNF